MKQCRNRRGQLLFGHGWDRCCRCSRRMMSLVVMGRGRSRVVVVVAGTVQSSVSTTPTTTTTTASSTTSSTAEMRTSTIVATGSILISLGWSSMMAVVGVLSRGGCFDRLGTGGTVHRRRRRRRGWCGGCNFGVGTTSISSISTSTVGLTRLMIATSSSSGSRC